MWERRRARKREGERMRDWLREALATPFYYIMRPSRSSSNGQHLQRVVAPCPCPYLHTCPTTRASLQIQLAPLLVGLPVPASTTKCVMRVHLQRQRRVAAFAFDVSDITNYAQEQPAKGPPSMSTGTPPPPTPQQTTTTQWRATHGAQWRWAGSGSASGSQVECGNVAMWQMCRKRNRKRDRCNSLRYLRAISEVCYLICYAKQFSFLYLFPLPPFSLSLLLPLCLACIIYCACIETFLWFCALFSHSIRGKVLDAPPRYYRLYFSHIEQSAVSSRSVWNLKLQPYSIHLCCVSDSTIKFPLFSECCL